MVMTIVPFHKHGRPWSDHGQMMVISWPTMVDHGLTKILSQGRDSTFGLIVSVKRERMILKVPFKGKSFNPLDRQLN